MEKTKQLLATAGVVLTLTPQVLSTTQAVKAAKIVVLCQKGLMPKF